MRLLLALLTVCTVVSSCRRSQAPAPAPEPADTRVRALADAYVDGFLNEFPEQVTSYGIAGRRHDRLTDNSLTALATWQAQEDRWLSDVRAIDPVSIQSGSLRATFAILREALESSVSSRVCRSELWNVSQMTGWQVNYGYF